MPENGVMAGVYAAVWRANEADADELRAFAAASRERVAQIGEEIAALVAEGRALEAAMEPAIAAAKALRHFGKRPAFARETVAEPQTVALRVLSQTRPPAVELEGRDVAYVTEGAA